MENDSVAILKSKIEVTANIADRLAYSVTKAAKLNLNSIGIEKLKNLSDEEMEVIDAYIFRYGSLISNIQDSLFKSIGALEQEPVSTMSNRDRTNLMERIGALPSAGKFSGLAVLRNKLMHDYPEEMQRYLERIHFITSEAPGLLKIFLGIVHYSRKFGIDISMDEFKHLVTVCPPE